MNQAFWCAGGGVRTRPEKGLLGGMTEVPNSRWLAGQDDRAALQHARLRSRASRADIARRASSPTCSRIFRSNSWSIRPPCRRARARRRACAGVPVATLADEAFPNVMRKAIAHALG
jgi:A/G-specific adenine glycosylase